MKPRLYGIVLAAGLGLRMGGPKSRLVVQGESLLDRHAARLRDVGCDDIALVVRPPFASGENTVTAITSSPAESLGVGLRFLRDRCPGLHLDPNDRIVITPIDMLPARRSTFDALFAALEHSSCATPTHRNKSGHPVALRFDLVAPYLHGRTEPLRDLIRRCANDRARIEVDDIAILGDFNTPADLRFAP